MYLSDSHTHSSCSPDGSATMLQMVEGAIAAGVQELTITDHCDLLSMQGTITLDFDWSPLRAQYAPAREYAAQKGLRLNYGIEIAGVATFQPVADAILQEPLDFTLASVHNLSVSAGCTDFYDLNYAGHPELCIHCMEDYFSSMEATVAWGNFDSLAHVPYLLRYMRDRDGMPLSLAPWEGRIRGILRQLIAKDKALELNTSRGKSVEDYRALFTWYRQEGGKLVTLGSDAHCPDDIGKGLREAQALLTALGYPCYHIYHRHKPEEIAL